MKNTTTKYFLIATLAFSAMACKNGKSDSDSDNSSMVASEISNESNDWQLGPFIKADSVNPILTPKASSEFKAPIINKMVRWEEKDVFNPSAV